MRDSNEASAPENSITYRTPIYIQLREIVRNKIDNGEYPPGTAIPSENELAETYGINRITVRNAMDALVNEGLLQRVQGKGVFVVGSRLEQDVEEFGGFILTAGHGTKTSNVKEQVKSTRPAGDKYARIFGIGPDTPIFYLRQLILQGEEPISADEIFIPQDILPNLDMVNSSVFSMSEVFAFYGVEMNSMKQDMKIVVDNPRIKKLLDMPDEVALIMMECTYSDKNGRVIEYSRSYYRSDRCTFKIQLHKR